MTEYILRNGANDTDEDSSDDNDEDADSRRKRRRVDAGLEYVRTVSACCSDGRTARRSPS